MHFFSGFLKTMGPAVVGVFVMVLCAAAPLAVQGAPAVEPDLKDVIEKVEQYYKGLSDLQARFVQVARILSYPEDQRSEGTFYLKRKQKMRWDYEVPVKDQYFIDGETAIAYSPDVKQARRLRLAGKGGVRSPLVFFEGLTVAQAEYAMAFSADPSFDRTTRYILELTPKERKNPPLRKILLFVDKANFQVVRVDQYDLYGNVTELYFKESKVNQGLSDTLFRFDPPKGVEVIDQP